MTVEEYGGHYIVSLQVDVFVEVVVVVRGNAGNDDNHRQN